MASREQILAELEKRGVFNDPTKAPIIAELRKRGVFPPAVEQQPSMLNKATKAVGEAALAPVRGIRSLGVMAQKGIEKAIPGGNDPSFEEVIGRGAEATKPGFEPKPGEKIGSFVGEQAAIAGLTAPLTAARAGATGLKAAASLAVRGGIGSGGLTAVQSMADKGNIDLKGTIKSSVIGAALPIAVPALGFIARLAKGTGKTIATAGSTISREAIDEASQIPLGQLNKYKNVQQRVEDLQKGVFGALEEAGTELNKARQKLGLPNLKEVRRAQLEKFGDKLPPVQDTIQAAEEAMQIAAENQYNRASATYLDSALHALDHHIEFAGKEGRSITQAALKEIRKELKNAINKTPGGDVLQAFEKEYSVVKSAADDLFNAATDEGAAEQLVQRILKGDENIVGKSKDLLASLTEIERRTGKKLVDPVKKALAARQVTSAKAQKISGIENLLTSPLGLITEASKGGTARVAGRAGEVVGNIVESVGRKAPILSPGLASELYKGRKQRAK